MIVSVVNIITSIISVKVEFRKIKRWLANQPRLFRLVSLVCLQVDKIVGVLANYCRRTISGHSSLPR